MEQAKQQECQAPLEVSYGKCEEVARRFLPVERETNSCDPKCAFMGDARSVDHGVVAEAPVGGNRFERDEILCHWNAREAARPALGDLTQLSREYDAKAAFAEVQSDPDSLDKSTSAEFCRSERRSKARCRQGSAVEDRSKVCEQRCANENCCIGPECLTPAASRGSYDRSDLS